MYFLHGSTESKTNLFFIYIYIYIYFIYFVLIKINKSAARSTEVYSTVYGIR